MTTSEPITCEVFGPIVIIRYHHSATDEQYAAYLATLTRHLLEGAKEYPRLGQIHDASDWTKSNPRQRQMQAEWIKTNMGVLKDRGGFAAFVFKSALIRGGLTAVMWLVHMPGPYKICATLAEARAWIEPRVIG